MCGFMSDGRVCKCAIILRVRAGLRILVSEGGGWVRRLGIGWAWVVCSLEGHGLGAWLADSGVLGWTGVPPLYVSWCRIGALQDGWGAHDNCVLRGLGAPLWVRLSGGWATVLLGLVGFGLGLVLGGRCVLSLRVVSAYAV